MATIRLTWNLDPLYEEGIRIYRSTSPMSVGSLPAPIVELTPDRNAYLDHDVVDGTTYYYRVSSYAGTEEKVGEEVSVTAQDALPFVLHPGEMRPFSRTPTKDVLIPKCSAGDVIVIYGGRREAMSPPAGYTELAVPPNGSYDQWTYAYTRVADGSESNTLVTLGPDTAADDYFSACVCVISHPTTSVSVTPLAAVRQPTGSASGPNLEVTNAASRALLMVVTSWVYAPTIDEGTVSGTGSDCWPVTPLVSPVDGPHRHQAFFLTAEASEAVSIDFEANASNSNDSRSDIWLAFTAD